MQQMTDTDNWNEMPWEGNSEDLETIHVYFVPEHPHHLRSPNHRDTLLLCLALVVLILCLVGLCLIPGTPTSTMSTITVPARFTVHALQTTVTIVPTGKQVIPATYATGPVTFYNGSFLTEQVPAGLILTTSSGIEIVTDQAVIVPAGNPPAYGMATVEAHAASAGVGGNIAAYAINQIDGSALYVKNLRVFTGGRDASVVVYATSQDVSTALDTARSQLVTERPVGLTSGPCSEKVSQKALVLSVTWACSLVSYTAPKGVQVLSVKVQGASVVLTIRKEQRPLRLPYRR